MREDLQEALARCEVARFNYRIEILASLRARGRGAAIRRAISEFQAARRELSRVTAGALRYAADGLCWAPGHARSRFQPTPVKVRALP